MRNKETRVSGAADPSNVRSGKVMDFIAKIVCLIGAFCLWFYAMSADVVTVEREFVVPVKIENETALYEKTGWSILSGRETNIVITLKGRRNIITEVAESDIHAYVDVSGVSTAGRQTLDIKVNAPGECEIVKTSVSNISPYIDKRLTKNVPVKVIYTDYTIGSEYQLDEPVTNITEVSVTGPESELRRVAAAQATLSLGNITQTINAASSLKLVDVVGAAVNSNYISMNVSSVNVTVKLFAMKEVPLKIGYKHGYFNDQNVKVSISPKKITLRGEPSVLDDISSIYVATIDEKSILANSTQNVSIVLPDGVTQVESLSKATITIEHINTVTKELPITSINLLNSNGLDCEIMTNSLNVTLRGPYSMISGITEADVSVYVDLKNYTSGSGINVVAASIRITPEYSAGVYELGSYNVAVNIK